MTLRERLIYRLSVENIISYISSTEIFASNTLIAKS